MLARYASEIRRIDMLTEMQIRRYMAEHGTVLYLDCLYESLEHARLCQADLVLSLLRINTKLSLRYAERIVGKPITHCPPMLALRYVPPKLASERKRSADERRVLRVKPPREHDNGRRRLLTSAIYDRIALIKVGMTVRHALTRGVRRKDLRIAVKRGYVKLEAA